MDLYILIDIFELLDFFYKIKHLFIFLLSNENQTLLLIHFFFRYFIIFHKLFLIFVYSFCGHIV